MFSKFTSLFKSKKPDAAPQEAPQQAPAEAQELFTPPVVEAPQPPPVIDESAPTPEIEAVEVEATEPPAALVQTPEPMLQTSETAPQTAAVDFEPVAVVVEHQSSAFERPVLEQDEPQAAVFTAPLTTPAPEEPAHAKPERLGFFARIKQGLARTTSQFAEGLGNLFLGKKAIDDELLEDLETQLLVADVGIEATSVIIEDLTARVARKQLDDSDALFAALQENLRNLLLPVEKPLVIPADKKPFVILVIGVNGAGKTTTIGKLAHRFLNEGKSVMLAAGDTFRAAAVEQLQVWGERNKVPVIAQHTGADSASVIFDALNAARARQVDVLIADTAGRLHNKSHLMDELSKVKRVLAKIDPESPHETLLVLDAGTGQNAVNQCDQFHQSLGVTGLALTKLDGTAKGGIIFALSQKHKIPVRFIGVGETLDDLQPFAARPFVDALFGKQSPQ
jgi:fused signal recognition particle receptor